MQISRRALSIGIGLGLPLVSNFAFAENKNSEDIKFENISKGWLEVFLNLSPVQSTQIGDHRFDSLIDDLSEKGRLIGLNFYKKTLSHLSKIKKEKLSRANQVDYLMLENWLKSTIFNNEIVKEYSWNPLMYQSIAGGAIYNLMARDYDKLENRLKFALARLAQLPQLFTAIRAQIIVAKVPQPHAKTYAAQHKGIMSVWNDMVKPHLSILSPNLQEKAKKIEEYVASKVEVQQKWIDETLLPNAKGDFRVGAKIFDQALKHALLSDLSRQDIKTRAYQEIKNVRLEMYEIAQQVLKGKMNLPNNPDEITQQKAIKAAIDLAASARPPRNDLVETSRKSTEIAREFVIAKDLITLPSGPVKIILMPEFQRGYAVAYCDSPGPLDKNLDTFYAVSPIPDDWNDAQAESFLREYNLRGIQDIAVHEAMPGHYVQLFHGNSYNGVLRAVLSSGSFVEGWAVYAERLMVEEGFLKHDPLYKLTQLKVYLRTITNALIDQLIHCENMTEAEMMKLLTETAFQEEREAAGKWRRAQLSYTQLSTYFVGFVEHFEARKAYKAKMGEKFNIKKYNDSILSFGMPPVKFARALLLDEAIK